ncbi:HNH endonuclease [Rhodococcus sp. Chr-9]|uniref:HNH endonuclease n=1 Tax=Rhodococcus sp. Chr-9 TaxID=713612 RepID=UPI00190F6ABE|nr:HNH endonuclease [Rhodococcus sp. Chr-9]
MTAILLCWNPQKWNGWNYESFARSVRKRGPRPSDWSIANHRTGIGPGTEAWFLKQGGIDASSRGILGHATVTDIRLNEQDPKDPNKRSNFVEILFDWLLPESDLLDVLALENAVPGVPWRKIYRSGTSIDSAQLPALRAVWAQHAQHTAEDEDEDQEVPGTYPEGASRTVQVNRFERSREAREACIAHHGTTCKACGLDFQGQYGRIGTGYIQVHHVVPISQIGENYQVDPITDLVPLCANCHVMAHRRKPHPYTVPELRKRIKRRS